MQFLSLHSTGAGILTCFARFSFNFWISRVSFSFISNSVSSTSDISCSISYKNHADVHKTLRYINGNCSTNLVFRWFARLRLRCVVLADFIFVLSYLLVQVRRLRSCSTRFGFLTSFLHKQFNAMPHLLQAEYQFVQCLRAPSRLASRISPLCACSF